MAKKVKKKKAEVNLYDIMNGKKFYCRHCNEAVTFTDEDILNANASPVCDGINFICDKCNFEDDISQMYCVFKDGKTMNVEDFYNDYGFDRSLECIIRSLNLLADR